MQTTQIGNLHWTTENLNQKQFKNGDAIPLATSLKEVLHYAANQQPCCCYYNFDESNKMYGLLYNWYACADDRGLAPEGFRVADHMDVEQLFEELKNLNANPYDYNILEKDVLFRQTQFNPTPSGYLCIEDDEDAVFDDLHKYAWYWTSSTFPDKENWAPVYNFFNEDWDAGFYEANLYSYSHEYSDEPMGSMLAVRCVKTGNNNGNKSVADQLDDLLNGLNF